MCHAKIQPYIPSDSGEVDFVIFAIFATFSNGERGAVVKWLEQLGYGAGGRRIA